MANQETVDVLIVGSGMGGATAAAGLAPTGARILILERGARLRDSGCARRPRDLSARRFPPRRDLARRRWSALQSGQLLLCRRQFQALRRRAVSLPGPGLRTCCLSRWRDAGLAFFVRGTRALVRAGRDALQCSRRDRVRSDGARTFDPLPL